MSIKNMLDYTLITEDEMRENNLNVMDSFADFSNSQGFQQLVIST
jgi:hypothetical protein